MEQQDQVPKGMCETFQEIVEDYFDEMGAKLDHAWAMPRYESTSFAKKKAHMDAGIRIIDETIDWIIAKQTSKRDEIKQEFMTKYFKWYTNVLKDEPEIRIPEGFDMSRINELTGRKFEEPREPPKPRKKDL